MAVQRTAISRRRWQRRTLTQLVMLVLVALLFSFATIQMWAIAGDGPSTASAERDGVAYLRPLNGLVAELAEAQSSAVRGGSLQSAVITTAIAAVDNVDQRYGESLRAHRRWVDARKAINDLLSTKPAGASAFDQYGEVISVVIQLSKQVADASKLVLDSQTSSYYLMDAAVIRLPEVIVSAGRAADLAILAPAEGPQQTQIFVARFDVASATEAIGVGLAKSLEASDSRSLGTSITGQLDAFRSSVDAFVPSGTRLRGLESVDSQTLARTAGAVRRAARSLADAVLVEFDKVLSDRYDSTLMRQVLTIVVAVLGLLITIALAVMMLTHLRPSAARPGAAGPGRQAGPAPSGHSAAQLIDPHDLLSAEERVPVRVSAPAVRRERGANAPR